MKNIHTSKMARVNARRSIEKELAQTHSHLSAGLRKQFARDLVRKAVKKMNEPRTAD